MSRSVCYDVSLRVLRRKCHCKSSRMFNHSLHHHLLLWWWWFFILFSWFMTVNGRYLAFAKMAKWSDFSLHFLTELGCEMLADNGFVAYITQHTKNPSIWMEYLKHQKIAFYRHSVWKWIKKSTYPQTSFWLENSFFVKLTSTFLQNWNETFWRFSITVL